MSPPGLHILIVFETELLQYIWSCMAHDVLIELKKNQEITRWTKEEQVMILVTMKCLSLRIVQTSKVSHFAGEETCRTNPSHRSINRTLRSYRHQTSHVFKIERLNFWIWIYVLQKLNLIINIHHRMTFSLSRLLLKTVISHGVYGGHSLYDIFDHRWWSLLPSSPSALHQIV